MSLPVAILAGGLATRLRPLTERVPKILLDIAGRPFAEHQIELLRRAGIKRIVYCLGYLGEQVADVLGDGSRWRMHFSYVFDGPRPLGTGGALRLALPQLSDAFFVMYGDSYLECDFGAVERSFRASGQPGLMTVFRNENRWGRSNVKYDNGRIIRYDKTADDPTMQHIDYGLGILTPAAFDAVDQPTARPIVGPIVNPIVGPSFPPTLARIPASYGETRRSVREGGSSGASASGVSGAALDLATVYQRLIDRDALAGYEVQERFYEIGSPEGLEELRAKLEARARTLH